MSGFTYLFSDPSPGLEQTLTSVTYTLTDGNTNAILPSTVVTIADSAFSTSSVKTVITSVDCSFATGLISISNSVFSDCIVLTSITGIDAVTSIGPYAFNQCNSLPSISWPIGAHTIESGTFFGCLVLTNITVPTSVTSILGGAFQYCVELTSITLERLLIDNLTILGGGSFSNTSSINSTNYDSLTVMLNQGYTQVILANAGFDSDAIVAAQVAATQNLNFTYSYSDSPANTNVTSVTYADNGDPNTTNAVLPSTVVTIADSAFATASVQSVLTSVICFYATGLTSIGQGVFSSCIALATVIVPSSVISIGQDAFNTCTGLTSIMFMRSTVPLTTLGSNSFLGTTSINSTNYSSLTRMLNQGYLTANLTTASFDPAAISAAEVEASQNLNFTYSYSDSPANTIVTSVTYADIGDSNTTNAVLPSSVITIAESAFATDSVRAILTSVNCSYAIDLRSIGNSVFYDCSVLTSITGISSVTSIGSSAFQNCSFPIFSWPSGARIINNDTFNNCSSLTSISGISSVTSIGSSAFRNCRFPIFSWPSGAGIINDDTFNYCSLLTSITGISSVTSIGSNAFLNCGFTTFSWPTGALTINNATFLLCRSLISFTVPNSVTLIGSVAFDSCTALTSITFERSYPDILTILGYYPFSNTSSINSTNYDSLTVMLNQGYTQVILANAGFDSDAIVAAQVAATQNLNFTYSYSDSPANTTVTSVTYADIGDANTTNAVLPSTVVTIADSAFATASVQSVMTGVNCSYATGLITIGSGAFSSCSALTSVRSINSVTNIGSSAFSNCIAIDVFIVPSSVISIGQDGFQGCSGLTSIVFQRLLTDILTTLGTSSFLGTTSINLTNYSSLSVMLDQGYSTADLTTAGFDPAAIAAAVAVRNNNFTYEYSDPGPNTILIRVQYADNGDPNTTNVILPYTVVTIANSAFSTESVIPVITSVDCSLATGLRSIEQNAFYDCLALTSISSISSVMSIGIQSFYNCRALRSFLWPSGATTIVNGTFQECSGLTSITGIEAVTSIEVNSFSNCRSLPSFLWPSGATTIDYNIFSQCNALTSITGIEFVTLIQSGAFQGCQSLRTFSWPSGASTINNGTFAQCYSLTSITGIELVTNIQPNSFDNCRLLASFSWPSGALAINSEVFVRCSALTSISGIELVTAIGPYAFSQCSVLASFSWPSGALAINNGTFENCLALTSITGIEAVTSIGLYAFNVCSSLASFSWPSGAKIIDTETFNRCSALTSIIGISSVTSIGQTAFQSCIALPSFSWPSGSLAINNNTFKGCSALASFTVPSSVTSIGQNAFQNCLGLSSITLQRLLINILTTLGSNSFLGTISINSTNYSSLTRMILQGYTSTNLTTAGFDPVAITLAVAAAALVCFKENTKILTDKGYIPIQNLRKGDLVKTLLNDYKPIVMIGKRDIYHLASQERIKDQLYKCSRTEYPEVFEDLVITGCHSILVDNFISDSQKEKVIEINKDIYVTDNKYRLPACLDDRASVYETSGNYTIYHLALENDDYYFNYGIYANGLLVETCSKRYLKELSNMIMIE